MAIINTKAKIMENSNGKTILAILTGVAIGTAIGAGIGILYAPRKGKKTRRRIRHTVVGTAYDASNWIKHSKDNLTKAVHDKKNSFQKLEDTVSTMSHKAEHINTTMEDKLEDIKKKNA